MKVKIKFLNYRFLNYRNSTDANVLGKSMINFGNFFMIISLLKIILNRIYKLSQGLI